MSLPDFPFHTGITAALIYVVVVVVLYITLVGSTFFYRLRPYGFDQGAASSAWWFALIFLLFNGYLHVVERTGEHVHPYWMVYGNLAVFAACTGFYAYHLWKRGKRPRRDGEHRKNSIVVYFSPILYPVLFEDHMSLYAEKYLVDGLNLLGSALKRVF